MAAIARNVCETCLMDVRPLGWYPGNGVSPEAENGDAAEKGMKGECGSMYHLGVRRGRTSSLYDSVGAFKYC